MLPVAACLLAALLAPAAHRRLGGRAGWVLGVVPLALTAYFASMAPESPVASTHPWVPALGVELAFRTDGLSQLFALVVCGIGTLVVVYTGGYLDGDPGLGRLLALLLAFMGAMLGLVTADDLILLVVFWELTSVASFLMIGFDHRSGEARGAAQQALLTTGLGGLALLAGVLLLGHAAGSFELSVVLGRGDAVREHPLYLPALALVLLGAFAKSAQVPFHFWLPAAMHAPTPVSAYLHSATLVKAGIYLLLRLRPVLGGTEAWIWAMLAVGACTAAWGALVALRQTDLKRVLAYSTVAALGQLVLLLGVEEAEAVEAAIVYLLAHSLYKGGLFLVVGAVDHATGTRDVRRLGGLARAMPVTTAAAALAGLSMAGLPPLLGFVSKEASYGVKLGVEGLSVALAGVGVFVNALTFAAAGVVVLRGFFGAGRGATRPPHEARPSMLLGPVVLAASGLALGLAAAWAGAALVTPAAAAVVGGPVPPRLELWHGTGPAFALSLVTVLAGGLILAGSDVLRRLLRRTDRLARWGPAAGYEAAVSGVQRLGRWQMRRFEARPLAHGLLTVFTALAAGVAAAIGTEPGRPVAPPRPEGLPHEWALAALVVAAAGSAVLTGSRLLALMSLGVVGFATALVYVSFGAPDLAITQFLVETLVVVLAGLLLLRLPPAGGATRSTALVRARDLAVALGAGGAMAALVLAATRLPLDRTVADFYAVQSVPGAHGRNIVNLILVDFRALDTLGEAVVVAVAGLGVLTLLRRSGTGPGRPVDSLILRTATRILPALLLLVALFLLFRGHYAPGGGFVASLIAALAVALVAVALGAPAARRMLRLEPRRIIALGLGLVLASTLPDAVAGLPLLTGLWATLPVREGVEVGTPLLFDLGVSIAVLGAVVAILLRLEEA